MIDSRYVQRVELEIVRGQAQQRRRPVTGRAFLIGCSCECDLVLSAAQFAEVYACIIVLPGGVTVRQVGDGPPIRVNGRRPAETTLRNGDRLVAGPFEFLIHIAPRESAIGPRDVTTDLPPASRWSTAQQFAQPVAMRDAAQLLDDIRAAFQERPAMRRPA